MNTFSCVGNLGKDVRVNEVNGTSVANFPVACKSGYGDREQTIWVDCALWGRAAESKLTDYLTKGQGVSVSGELGTREHNDKTYLTLRVDRIDLTGGKGSGQASEPRQAPQQQEALEDDIPF